MACIRKRRDKWVVDYRDAGGIRRWVTCDTKNEAQDVLADKIAESRPGNRPAVDTNITVARYSVRYLEFTAQSVKPRTLRSYEHVLDLHILPKLGKLRVRDLDRGRIKLFLAHKLSSGLSRNTVRIIHATLRSMLNAAVDDRLILANPAERLGRQLRLLPSKTARQESIKAFNREQVAALLAGVQKADPLYASLFLTLARTGMRIGESLALQWDDIDFEGREIRVARAFSDGELSTPKSGHGRSIDLSRQLGDALSRLLVARKATTLKKGWASMPPWVFCTARGTVIDQANVRRAMKRSLKAAELPGHFTVHSLRHTFASLLLQQGESPAYVQRQLGHASIQLTVDTYGKWLPMGNKQAVDRLDDGFAETPGSKVVADAGYEGAPASGENLQHAGFSGGI